ncbi:hypothetical protein B0T16DRAFT_328810 [Cercophora newfieldiana]|uniref:Uncharacterized protein n=1 Tax=Cercophora newfieldiana TaxID=92897 RepID=A0AA40CRD4_9PEZI|nr:hypothetical protein B0T16DRAFT_328810 [Cercophora newfieldiana]
MSIPETDPEGDGDGDGDGRPPHIAQAADEAPAREKVEQPPSRPLPTPISSFATPRRPPLRTPLRTPIPIRRWEPKCNHPRMARLYSGAYKCSGCGRSGHFGWLYRCVMDRDILILNAKSKGEQYAFDALGLDFGKMMSLGKFGADSRILRYSFLREITEEQLHTYTPLQLGRVLSQRDHVHRKIYEERHGLSPSKEAAQKYPNNARPWVPDKLWECQAKLCHDCHRIGSDKSWLSLNGIMNNDIPPHAATGFSFSNLGFRPEADVEVVKNIGYRAVPLVRFSSLSTLVFVH